MNCNNKIAFYLFSTVLFLFVISGLHAQINVPIAKNGILNLTNYNFKQNGNIRLEGEWSFYNNKFLNLDQIEGDDSFCFVTVPKNLKGQICHGEKLLNKGWFSYFK